MIFASCYRPPKTLINEPPFEEIKRLTKKNLMWTGGYFNLPDIDWQFKSIINQ